MPVHLARGQNPKRECQRDRKDRGPDPAGQSFPFVAALATEPVKVIGITDGGTIGILGGGQLGRMMALAARTLGFQVQALDPDAACPQCREMKPPHVVCPNCGYYRGRQVKAVAED